MGYAEIISFGCSKTGNEPNKLYIYMIKHELSLHVNAYQQ